MPDRAELLERAKNLLRILRQMDADDRKRLERDGITEAALAVLLKQAEDIPPEPEA